MKILFASNNSYLLKELDSRFSVTFATSMEELQRLMKADLHEEENSSEPQNEFDIVIIDDDFFHKDFLMFLSKIRNNIKFYTILLLKEENATRFLHYGLVDDFLIKPLSISCLLHRINFLTNKVDRENNSYSLIFSHLKYLANNLALKIYDPELSSLLSPHIDHMFFLNHLLEIINGKYEPQRIQKIFEKLHFPMQNWSFYMVPTREGKILSLLLIVLMSRGNIHTSLQDNKLYVHLQESVFNQEPSGLLTQKLMQQLEKIDMVETERDIDGVIYRFLIVYNVNW